MKLFNIILAAILAFALCGCEEDDSPLRFSTVSNTSPENVKVEYYSPDPSCVARTYYVTTNRLGGELTLECDNAADIYFGEFSDTTGVSIPDPNTLVYGRDSWTVRILDGKRLQFTFNEKPMNPDLDFELENHYVPVCATTKGKTLKTSIVVWRDLHTDQPVN